MNFSTSIVFVLKKIVRTNLKFSYKATLWLVTEATFRITDLKINLTVLFKVSENVRLPNVNTIY